MKKTWIAAAAALVAVALVGSVAGTVTAAQNPPSADARPDASAVSASLWDLDRSESFTLAERDGDVAIDGARVIAAAPDGVSDIPVSLDQDETEQYWLWAYGVEVTAHGLTPGSTVRVGITFASGDAKHWAPLTADAEGTIVTRVRTLDVDPENTHPEAGLAQITVASSTGEAGSALLRVTANAHPSLSVSSDPSTISQDAFLDSPVVIHASGFPPMTKVFFNLGMPDTSMIAVGEDEGLHSDENGEFSYELQMASVNAQVGTWLLSFQSFDGALAGGGSFTVTAGAERVRDKTLTPAVGEISVADFSVDPGLRFAVDGFLPFDTYELTLTTSRGYNARMGVSRTNGEGHQDNAITSPKSVPEGEYTLTARSTTTGDYAVGRFRVTGSPTLPGSDIALAPATVAADALAAEGVVVSGSRIAPGTSFRVSLRDAGWNRQPLTAGADAYATVGDDGRLSLRLVTLEVIAPGGYTVWVEAGGGVIGYNLLLPLQVTASAAASETTTPAPMATTPPPAASETRLAPVTEAPALPQPRPETPSAPSPTPSPTATPAPGPFDDDMLSPALPVPGVPAL
ncbi:hypothetical protein [Microbacterium sp. SL75]|uniref:hypothetical protein n=1 Tax=Microbacterium sp. SL75 TaxID=2995140 RepID=UPI00226DB838|nr:hypothetical protein [Microbacterium sp. SL75]WAC70614.1 hypothetical protein OVA17_07955 [Microbacterium sp. SL75]